MEFKRENIGRALTETRSVPEIGGTWQAEEKTQRDMLFNRAQLDTLPPIRVPKLGGMDYRMGPGAQVPVRRGPVQEGDRPGRAAHAGAGHHQALQTQREAYFGLLSADVAPVKTRNQENSGGHVTLSGATSC